MACTDLEREAGGSLMLGKSFACQIRVINAVPKAPCPAPSVMGLPGESAPSLLDLLDSGGQAAISIGSTLSHTLSA